ncbi:antirepressor [Gordonia phage Wrigley]|nr:antirepressor [Gordonia phage Wrigley]
MSQHSTASAVVPFAYGDTQVRTVVVDGEPWFVAADVARILGYRMASDMTRRLDADDRGTRPVRTPSGEQDMTTINEPGLYQAVLGSQTAGARDFKRWVTHTVLPEIRRTGSYGAAPALPMSEDEIVLHALQIQNRKIEVLNAKVAADAPKVEAFDELMESDGTYSMNATAKVLGWGRNVMMRELRRLGVLQGNNLPYQRYEHHFKVVPQTYKNRRTGETIPTATTFVRPAGVEFLRKKLTQSTLSAPIREAVDA